MALSKTIVLADVRYSAWANQSLLEACSALTAEEIERGLGISHASILGTLQHIYDGERVWLDCLRSKPDDGPWELPQGDAPQLPLAEMRRAWPELSRGYLQWVENASENSLETELTVLLPGNAKPLLPRWKILRHVLNHSTLHRGQIVGMIRMLGHQPPQTDLMTYFVAVEPTLNQALTR
jgi:uncharacterized damage-inducible protein DinB